MLRSFLAAAVVVIGILGLGADLAQAAYSAAQTARLIVLHPG